MKYPAVIYMSQDWIKLLSMVATQYPDGTYGPARPYSLFPERLKAAWLVFTGRADALIWPGGQ